MSYELSFSNGFFYSEYGYGNWNILKDEKPTNCMDALIQMYLYKKDDFLKMLADVFNPDLANFVKKHGPHESMILDIINKIQETNTCSNLNTPVQVWINEGEYGPGHTINIWE